MAAHIGLDWDNTIHWWLPTYDEDARSASPGRLLLQRVLQLSYDRGDETFDFLRGSMFYKWIYATHFREVVEAGRRPWRRQLELTRAQTKRRFPGVTDAVRRARDKVTRRPSGALRPATRNCTSWSRSTVTGRDRSSASGRPISSRLSAMASSQRTRSTSAGTAGADRCDEHHPPVDEERFARPRHVPAPQHHPSEQVDVEPAGSVRRDQGEQRIDRELDHFAHRHRGLRSIASNRRPPPDSQLRSSRSSSSATTSPRFDPKW